MQFCFIILALVTVGSSSLRIRRDITRGDSNQQIFYPALPNQYGAPRIDQESHLQQTNYNLLGRIYAELNQIESLISHLISQYNSLHQNNVAIKSSKLPSEYGPPSPAEPSLYNSKFIRDNTETIQSSINNLKSIAQHLENELSKHVKRPSNRITSDKVPVIDPNQHYHISAAGVLPEFLTLDPYVGYGPAPNVNFAPPAPGANTGNTVSETDIYSPPDGVLLAPPAPGQYPIRTRIARR
ncbi:hypothetical protein M8J75_014889 [Diaphorina citri]|nr:hypothetical protein M8J75_014889 [Diaphorina citri]